MNKIITLFTLVTCLGALRSPAQAQHNVKVFLSDSGVKVVEEQAPSYIPKVLFPPTIARTISCMNFAQTDTVMNMDVASMDIVLVSETRIRIEMIFSLVISGQLSVDGCATGSCQDTLTVDNGHALLDFDLTIVGGKAQVVTRNVELDIRPDEFSFQLGGCGLTGDAINNAIEFGETWILDFVSERISALAGDSIGPFLQRFLGGLGMESPFVSASISDLFFPNDGISVTADVGFPVPFEVNRCTAEYDMGPPATELGASAPDMQNIGSDLGLAVNLGLVNNGFYSFWRTGLMCLDEQRIAALGVDLDLGMVGALLPGFPAGTTFTMETKLTDYPRLTSKPADGARLAIKLSGILLDVHGDRPDGTRNTLHVEASIEATALIIVNPKDNTIYAQLEDAEILQLVIEDERTAVDAGFDIAGIRHLVKNGLLPPIIEEIGAIPLTGAVFAALDYAVVLRTLTTNKAYLSAELDVFRAPKNDENAPDTQIAYPDFLVNPHTAIVAMTGLDAEVATELLQYEVTVDGEARPVSFTGEIKVGQLGVSKAYEVQVAAVDLAGNVDPSPSVATILVDGILPTALLSGPRNVNADEGPVTLKWTMNDDLSTPAEMPTRLEVYKILDSSDALSAKLIDTYELPPGTTSYQVDLSGRGGLYRVEVHVTDNAGNEGVSSMLLTSAESCGCSVGNSRSGLGTAFFFLLLGFLALGRRKQHHES